MTVAFQADLFWRFAVSRRLPRGCIGAISSIQNKEAVSIPGLVKAQIITYLPDYEKIFKKPADTRAGVTFSR